MTYSIIAAATILITALLAFYYLYKSKELDLGILMSVSIGAVILGITFNPTYNTIFGYMESFNNINRDVEFLFFIAIASIFFLILVFTISILVSVFVPDRLSSIDCSIAIERFFGWTKSYLKPEISENNIPEVTEADELSEDSLVGEADELSEDTLVAEADELSEDSLVEEDDESISISEVAVTVESIILEAPAQQDTPESTHTPVNEAEILVLKAFDYKVKGQKEQALQYYTKALNYNSLNSDMVFWIVLDICTLYKELGLNELAFNILDSVAQRYGSVLKPEIRTQIINNLK